jgi:hypothetical protein
MTSEPQMIQWSKAVRLGVAIGLVGGALLIQFRLLSICIVFVLALAFALFPQLRRRHFVAPAVVVVVISMVLPFDVAMGSFHYGSRRGRTTGGPHLVEFVIGLENPTGLIERYGEYVSGGCTWSAVYPPRLILVWN